MKNLKLNNLKKIFVLTIIMGCALFFALYFNGQMKTPALAEDETNEQNLNCETFGEDNFIVVLDKEISEVNKEHPISFFQGIDVDYIVDLTRKENNINVTNCNFEQILQIYLKNGGKEEVLQSIEIANKIPGVKIAEPNYVTEISQAPNDPYFTNYDMWGLNGLNGIHAPEAWITTTGSAEIRVGVIDTGIANHEDLNGNLVSGWDTHNNNGVTNDDTHSHGTHVAGIIGAVGNNGKGVTGVNWDVSLVPLQASNENNLFESSDVIEAIEWAKDRWGTSEQIDILNYSVGGFTTNAAVKNSVISYPGLFVWAAGNDGSNLDTAENFETYLLPNIISVGAIESTGDRLSDSNYGTNSVEVYAPGGYIISTVPNNQYAYKSGTSMAAPFVSGLAALLLAQEPSLTAVELKEIILDTADSITISVPNGTQVVKKLNAANAMDSITGINSLFADGNGEDEPFEISNETQLRNIEFAHRPVYVPRQGSEEQINYNFILTNDIVVSGEWMPFSYRFTGEFDGNGHMISYDLYLNQDDVNKQNNFGLFSSIGEGAVVKNLRFEQCIIQNSNTFEELAAPNNEYIGVGLLAGSISGALELNSVIVYDCLIDVNAARTVMGSIAGSISSTSVNQCSATGGVLICYNGAVGGMAGYGEINRFNGGQCSMSITKENYSEGDQIGPVISTTQSTGSVDTTGTSIHRGGECVAEGTLITLADGTQKAVEDLTGEEMLLVWNLFTGEFDAAPILFIDSDPAGTYEVVRLSFSDGTEVKVIYEHGFWDCTLNEYVYLDGDAAQYLGHWFLKQTTDEDGELISVRVQLTQVTITQEYTAAYSPVTYGHFCYFVNGMLSMPGGIEGMFNIFEVDAETMQYDEAQMQADIAQYGLFTYEEFAQLYPVPEEMFEACGGQYLKVALGKGLITGEGLEQLIARYAEFFAS